jgi:hypothetical protein
MLLFEWDPVKARTNQRKHGVTFEDAIHVFLDPCSLSWQDRVEGGELRWQTIGLAGGAPLLFVAHTSVERGDDEIIRLISARRATRKERTRYEQSRPKDVR